MVRISCLRRTGRLAIFAAAVIVLGLATSVGTAWVAATLDADMFGDNEWLGEFEGQSGVANGWHVGEWRHQALHTRVLSPAGPVGWLYRNKADDAPLDMTSLARRLPATDSVHEDVIIVEKESGWPTPCMRATWGPYDPRVDRRAAVLHNGVVCELADWGTEPTPMLMCGMGIDSQFESAHDHAGLPLQPVWPALLVNSAQFSSIWAVGLLAAWPFLALPGAVRRRWRKTHDRCVACGYDREGLEPVGDQPAPCPECGSVGKRGPVRVPVVLPTTLAVLACGAVIGFGYEQWRHTPKPPPVFVAAERGDAHALHVAAVAGVDLADGYECDRWGWLGRDLDDQAPLAWAAAHGHTDAVRVLLDAGPNPWTTNTKSARSYGATLLGDAALELAAQQGHAEVCRLLADHLQTAATGDARVAATADDILHRAATAAANSGSASIMRTLLDAGLTERADSRLLISAVSGRNAAVTDLLLRAGHDPDHGAGQWRGSALMQAYLWCQPDMFEMLLAAGGDPDVRDIDGRSLLHHPPRASHTIDPNDMEAFQRQRIALMERAVSPELGLAIDGPSATGKTPLMYAVSEGDLRLVRILLKAGADVNATDTAGHSAIEYARGQHRFQYQSGGRQIHTRPITPDPEIIKLLEATEAL